MGTPTCRSAAATCFVRQPFCSSKMPNLKLGDVVPNFDADTTDGKINFHEWTCDSVESHKGWIEDIKAYNKLDAFSYPIIADPDRPIANTYGMMDPDEMDSKGLPLTCRAVFVIGP